MKNTLTLLSACALLIIGCATKAETPAVNATYIGAKTHSINDRYFIGPQPTATDLAALKAAGITKVINFRTPAEMDKLAFSEPELLAKIGIDYALIPVGGEAYGYTPAQMSALDSSLEGALEDDGKVLLHCGSGYRASVIMVAWLVQEQGMSLDEAITHAEGWWPLSLEKVLGRKLTVEYADQ